MPGTPLESPMLDGFGTPSLHRSVSAAGFIMENESNPDTERSMESNEQAGIIFSFF